MTESKWLRWSTDFRCWPPHGHDEAACRRWSAQLGHATLERALNTPPALTRDARSPILHFTVSSFAVHSSRSSSVSAAVAIASAKLAALLLRHRRSFTALLPSHRTRLCSLAAPVRPQHRARPRRSSAVEPVVVATPAQSTILCVILCARFSMVSICSSEP